MASNSSILIFLIKCISELPCPKQPPPALEGEGTERIYGPEITLYRLLILLLRNQYLKKLYIHTFAKLSIQITGVQMDMSGRMACGHI